MLATICSRVGYANAIRGRYGDAIQYYDRAIFYIRETSFSSRNSAQMNNLGRALSEMGRNRRGRRICIDALDMRRAAGYEIPVAWSLNTIALIDNNLRRHDLAWREAAKAVAYFRRANQPRGMILSLKQLAIALRRMAKQENWGKFFDEPADRIYAEAEHAAQEAISIHNNQYTGKEPND